jgi:hypothetical protein
MYNRRADKPLARPARKQSKSMSKSSWMMDPTHSHEMPSYSALDLAEIWRSSKISSWIWSIISGVVGLRTYQHPAYITSAFSSYLEQKLVLVALMSDSRWQYQSKKNTETHKLKSDCYTHTFVFSLFCTLLFHYIPMDKETHVFITNSNIIKNVHYHH